nr:hypothetical protein CFP56_71398 [Quercus suber]
MADQAITSTYYKGMSIMGLREIKLGVLGRIIIFFVMQCVEFFETIILWAEPEEEEVMVGWCRSGADGWERKLGLGLRICTDNHGFHRWKNENMGMDLNR